jgi:putative restriction endonuclease
LRSVLEEFDGPMLRHGLQEIDGWPIQFSRRRAELPDRDLLAQRHAHFITYGGART